MCRTTTHYYGDGDGDIDPFTNHNWPRLERCKCNNSLNGHVAVCDKVNDEKSMPTIMGLVRNNTNKKHRINKLKLLLEDIPEDKELRIDDDNNDVEYANPEVEEALEMDLEVLRRAFDMGIWVVCLGLGYMFSRANFRPPPTFS